MSSVRLLLLVVPKAVIQEQVQLACFVIDGERRVVGRLQLLLHRPGPVQSEPQTPALASSIDPR
jgi:hypothetical protein